MPGARTGSCGCGTLRFTVAGEIRNVANCHCSKCRKFSGAAFSTYAVVAVADFRLTTGEQELTRFQLPSGGARHFCRNCGSPIFNINPAYPDYRMVHLGALDQPQNLVPRMNIYCSTQLDWLKSLGDLPSYSGAYRR